MCLLLPVRLPRSRLSALGLHATQLSPAVAMGRRAGLGLGPLSKSGRCRHQEFNSADLASEDSRLPLADLTPRGEFVGSVLIDLSI